MAVTPGDIERLEAALQRNRDALKRGGTAVPISIGIKPTPPQKPIRVVFERQVADRTEHLVVLPVTLTLPRGLDVSSGILAKMVRFEYNRVNCDTQRRDVFFNPFVLCQQTGLFLPGSDKGSHRFSGSLAWQPFDAWLVFSGNQRDRRRLKALGVSFK